MNTRTVLVLLATVVLVANGLGCYTTRVNTPADRSASATHEERQWFTVGGLVGLSDPAGEDCQHGLGKAQSKMAGMDILINIGLSVGGYIAGSVGCSGDQAGTCASALSTLVPFLIGSRTVRYTCSAAPAAAGLQPNDQPGIAIDGDTLLPKPVAVR